MKKIILLSVTVVLTLSFPKFSFAQAPDFGDADGFAVFSSSGAFTNVGATVVTGNVGNNVGAFTAFPPGELYGQIHNVDDVSQQAATSLSSANTTLLNMPCEKSIDAAMGNDQILTPGVYCQAAVSTLSGKLVLDAQGDPNALFIIKLDATFTTAAASTLVLTNSASLCNVYWHVVGAVVLGNSSSFSGTIVSNGAITLNEGAVLTGRALTTAGAISLTNNIISIATTPKASIISTEDSTTFCAGASILLSGNVNGNWSNNESTPEITVSTSGDYFVTNSNLYCSIESNHINVIVNPLPIATVVNHVAICNGDNVMLGADALMGNTYAWTPESGLNSSLTSNPLASPSETTTYTLTETITATGCVDSNSVTVTVDNVLVASVITASGPTTFCGNEYVVLSGNSGGTWSNTATTSTPSLTVNTSGDYYVTNTNSCNTVESNHIMVTVHPEPSAITGEDRSICIGSIAALRAPAVSGNTYLWTPTTSLNSATSAHPYATPLTSTIYTLTETNTETGCSKSNAVIVTVNPLPPAINVGDIDICIGESVAIGGNSTSGNTYLWSPSIDLNSSIISNPIASPTDVITYTLTETINASGCSKSASLTVFVNPPPNILTQPSDQVVLIEHPAVFLVEVNGTNLTYQWRNGSTELINSSNISGADTDSLTIMAVTYADTSSNYNVVISGMCLAKTISQNALLSITSTTNINSSYIDTSTELARVFPNPFTNTINVVVIDSFQTEIEINFFNVLGVKVMSETLQAGMNIIETIDLNEGVYIYHIISKGKILQYGKLVRSN